MTKFSDLQSTLENSIVTGRMKEGDKLPAIRQLVDQFGYSKNTVIRALNELEANGFIVSKPRLGYFVSKPHTTQMLPEMKHISMVPSEVSLPEVFHTIMAKGAAFDLTPHTEQSYQPSHQIELNRCLSRAQKLNAENKAMYYDRPDGELSLKQQIAARYKSRGLLLNTDYLCMTSGCQNALFLALSSRCQPGDNVAVESPGFYGVLQLLEQLKLNIIEIPASPRTGMDLEKFKEVLEDHKIEACIVTPNFATPTGASMAEDAKQELVKLANHHEITLIEDDIYGELGFHQESKPLAYYDTENRVILCGSFSKSLSRDLRVGWVYNQVDFNKIVRMKLSVQLAGNKAVQQGVADFLRTGHYRRHLAAFKRSLLEQRNQLITALLQYWPSELKYTLPQGGLCLWVELDTKLDCDKLYARMLEHQIILTPGSLFSPSKNYQNCLRLSFNHPIVGERLLAIKRIGKELRKSF